ncbi:hypothetical protein ABW21_db0208904 [Orbilia brochopaga]|nr:hypothetical protein ABW21_db0208904 [Drechslerella brochopaga]
MSNTTTVTMAGPSAFELAPLPPIATSTSKGHRLDDLSIHTAPPPKSSADIDVESQPASPADDAVAPPEAVTAHNTAMERNIRWKTAATFFSLWIAGVNDGSTGALIPYLKVRYDIGLAFVAIVYIATFLGWFTAAMVNVHLIARLGMGGVLFLGSILQLVQYSLQCWVS